MLTILAIAIALAAFVVPASTTAAVTSKSNSLATQLPSLNSMFKQVENSVVQITSKIPINNNTMSSRSQNTTVLDLSMINRDI